MRIKTDQFRALCAAYYTRHATGSPEAIEWLITRRLIGDDLTPTGLGIREVRQACGAAIFEDVLLQRSSILLTKNRVHRTPSDH